MVGQWGGAVLGFAGFAGVGVAAAAGEAAGAMRSTITPSYASAPPALPAAANITTRIPCPVSARTTGGVGTSLVADGAGAVPAIGAGAAADREGGIGADASFGIASGSITMISPLPATGAAGPP